MSAFQNKGDSRILEISVSKDGNRRQVVLQEITKSAAFGEDGSMIRKPKLTSATGHQRRVNGDWSFTYPAPCAERSRSASQQKIVKEVAKRTREAA